MKCVSCKADVDMSMTHAIQMNICPYCGQGMLDKGAIALMSYLNRVVFVDSASQNLKIVEKVTSIILNNFEIMPKKTVPQTATSAAPQSAAPAPEPVAQQVQAEPIDTKDLDPEESQMLQASIDSTQTQATPISSRQHKAPTPIARVGS